VLLRKPPAHYEVWNDLEDGAVTFFRVLCEHPGILVRAVECTPFARTELDLACAPVPPSLDNVERARRVYVRSVQGRDGLPAAGRMGCNFERAATRSRTSIADWGATGHLWAVAARRKRFQFERDDALVVIHRFDGLETLFYAKPPYPVATRSERWRTAAYAHELTDDDHLRLAAALHVCGAWSSSAGRRGPSTRSCTASGCAWSVGAQTQAGTVATECLRLSPRTTARPPARQLALGE
jgi:DNA adenine methylase